MRLTRRGTATLLIAAAVLGFAHAATQDPPPPPTPITVHEDGSISTPTGSYCPLTNPEAMCH